MTRRLIKFVTVLSTVLLVLTVLLFLAGFVINPWEHYLSIGDDFHVSFSARGLVSRIIFFNDAEYGPYRGSIIQLVDDRGNAFPKLKREEAFGDSWGIYYRYFEWSRSGSRLWTLMVTLWYPIIIFATLPSIRVLKRVALRNKPAAQAT